MKNSEKELISFVQKKIIKSTPEIDLEQIDFKTDLSNLGIESIVIISLLTEIEEFFKIKISLSSLEKNNFIISVKSILESVNNE